MSPTSIATMTLVTLVLACKPNVGPPISEVSGPAILAVKGVPAEVDPKSADTTVAYEALAVDRGGRVPGYADADIREPLQWAMCDQPKPPTENNSVSAKCLDPIAFPGTVGTSATTYVGTVSPDACSLFGPVPPPTLPGQSPVRARDPDVTGGYYQPVRVELLIPEALRRVGLSTVDSLISFELQRVSCGLANAPNDVIRIYTRDYKLNANPVLTSLTMDFVDVPASSAAAAPIEVGAGKTISLAANWSTDSVEYFPAFDLIRRELAYHFESMRVSWYATGGTFEHDITGRGEDEKDTTYAENTWTADVQGLVHMWVVLHDSRGGTDFAAFDIRATP
jgi:hypothetical protein